MRAYSQVMIDERCGKVLIIPDWGSILLTLELGSVFCDHHHVVCHVGEPGSPVGHVLVHVIGIYHRLLIRSCRHSVGWFL